MKAVLATATEGDISSAASSDWESIHKALHTLTYFIPQVTKRQELPFRRPVEPVAVAQLQVDALAFSPRQAHAAATPPDRDLMLSLTSWKLLWPSAS